MEARPVELRVSPLFELWLDVRWRSEQEATPEDADLAAAVETMRALIQRGHAVRNLSGGMQTWRMVRGQPR